MHPLHAALDAGASLLPDHQPLVERIRQSGEGAVVWCRAEPAAQENVGHLGVAQLAVHLVDDLRRPVADLRDALDGIAHDAQPLGDPVRIGV